MVFALYVVCGMSPMMITKSSCIDANLIGARHVLGCSEDPSGPNISYLLHLSSVGLWEGKEVNSCAGSDRKREKNWTHSGECLAHRVVSLEQLIHLRWVPESASQGFTRMMKMGLTRNMWRHRIRSWRKSCQGSDAWRRPVGIGWLVRSLLDG